MYFNKICRHLRKKYKNNYKINEKSIKKYKILGKRNKYYTIS